jgi:surfactin synthase thioesterase subunit
MDVAIISAMSALVGSSIGALSSFSTTWLVQTSQLRSQHRGTERSKRERLYADFIAEAAKRMTDAMSHQAETPEVLVLLVASMGQMRLFSSTEVITAAEQVARLIVESYIAPNRSLKELRDAVMDGAKLDLLAQFAEACRKELGAMTA